MLEVTNNIPHPISANKINPNLNFKNTYSNISKKTLENDTFVKEEGNNKKKKTYIKGILLGLAAIATCFILKNKLKIKNTKKITKEKVINFKNGKAYDTSGQLFTGKYTDEAGNKLTYTNGRIIESENKKAIKRYIYEGEQLVDIRWSVAGKGHGATSITREDGKIIKTLRQTWEPDSHDYTGFTQSYTFQKGKYPILREQAGFGEPVKEYILKDGVKVQLIQ